MPADAPTIDGIHAVDAVVLDELKEGRSNPTTLRDAVEERTGDEITRQALQYRLDVLRRSDYIERVGHGLYEFIDDPRDD